MAFELLKLRELNKTVVLVTHSISEAVLLSDRVLVMTPRPGELRSSVEVDLAGPRSDATRAEQKYGACCQRVRETLKSPGRGQ